MFGKLSTCVCAYFFEATVLVILKLTQKFEMNVLDICAKIFLRTLLFHEDKGSNQFFLKKSRKCLTNSNLKTKFWSGKIIKTAICNKYYIVFIFCKSSNSF